MLRTIVRKSISTFIYFLKLIFPSYGVVVLMYHRVNDELEPDDLVVSTQTFRQQMEYLFKNNYKVIGIEEMITQLNNSAHRQYNKSRQVVITFDDGFRDNYLNAFPILKEFGFRATIFLTTGVIDTDKKFKRYEQMSCPEMLNWDEVREMSRYGIEFGAHTVNHPNLVKLNLEEAKGEIWKSKVSLESKGLRAKSFCYPDSKYNAGVKKLVKEAGFVCAFTVKPGANKQGCDLFELRRTAINGKDSLFDFKKKLAGGYDLLHKIIQRRLKNKESQRLKEISRKTDTQINILYVIWSMGLGGAERVVINLAKGLDKTRFNPIVCCLNDKGEFANELERDGIKVIALNKKGKFDISVIYKLICVIREYKIDIVHTHLWGANFWGRFAARLAGATAIIATEHNLDVWKKWYHKLLDRLLSRFTDKIIAVSEKVKKFYVEEIGLSEEKIKIIYNGVPTKLCSLSIDRLIRLKEELGLKDKEVIISVMGRIVPQKGHRFFLLALKELLKRHDVMGLIVGAGPLERDLKDFSQNLGLNGRVIFTGLRKDIPEVLKLTNILVMPSLREGLSITALEAMASGVPIVATNVGGNPELVKDGITGILVPPQDSYALTEALMRILEDKDLAKKLGENGRNCVEEYFSLERMVKQTQQLYEQCLIKKEKI